jgi:ATP-dependent DNA helicase RecG
MASSIQTLVKILRLERQKGYQNNAVIGGFARFSYHWAREAHSQAVTDQHHALVDRIEEELRRYDTLPADDRPDALESIIALATGEDDAPSPPPTPAQPSGDDVGIGEPDDYDEEGGDFFDPFGEDVDLGSPQPDAEETSVRERRGYAWRHTPPATQAELDALEQPVNTLKGVGGKRTEQLARLGVGTIHDMLMLLPRRHDDYSRMKFIKDLRPGDTVSVMGMLDRVETKATRNRRGRVEAFLKDQSGTLRLNWFNQTWIAKQLNRGEPYVISGTVDQYLGRLVMNNPQAEPLDTESLNAGRIVPVYPLTGGLSEKVMRGLMKDVVDAWAERLPDPLPERIREEADLMDYGDAIAQAHFPDTWQDKKDAELRLAFDDLFLLQLSLLRQRHEWQSAGGQALPVDEEWVARFEEALPFTFTGAQRRVIAEVRADMASERPMNRLIQGDVGSGKTVVAALAMAAAIENGTQAALMAPTSILAEQHYAGVSQMLATFSDGAMRTALLTGRLRDSEREEVYAGLAEGSIDVVIGTHAIIQEAVTFHNLGLAVIDEQHRFGVAQRGALREKAIHGSPHLLVMTATPIPRTLALTAHADLDLSIIDEMPPGRQPVQTKVIQAKERERAYAFIKGQVEQGRQAYIICPLVEDSDTLDARSAEGEYERLQEKVFPELQVGLVHGRMPSAEKDGQMAAFYAGETDILVSTTVIEVGVNVPNATVMMIENAPRFGLAQLHQLRGRVGRGQGKSYCLLVSDQNFFERDERLAAMERTTDGFELAEIDLQRRGAGDLLGFAQSGHAGLHLLDIHLIERVQRHAHALYERDPNLQDDENAALAAAIAEYDERAFGDIS